MVNTKGHGYLELLVVKMHEEDVEQSGHERIPNPDVASSSRSTLAFLGTHQADENERRWRFG